MGSWVLLVLVGVVGTAGDAVVGPGGYPRGVQLMNSQWLICAGMNVFASSDGISWSRRGTVLVDQRAGVDLGNCNLAQLPSGRVLASYRHHVTNAAGTKYALEVSFSDDSGEHWSPLSTMVHSAVGMWEPFLWPTTPGGVGGSIWCAYSQELTNGGLQSIVWQHSPDGGVTWEPAVTISDGAVHTSRDGMPGIARLRDGSLLLVFEGFWDWAAHNSTAHHFSIQSRRSFDNGSSWSAGEVLFSPPQGAKGINAGAPQVAASDSGVWVSFASDENLGTVHGNWIRNSQVELVHGTVGDDSRVIFELENRRVVGANQSLWAGLSAFNGVEFVLYGHRGVIHYEPVSADLQRLP